MDLPRWTEGAHFSDLASHLANLDRIDATAATEQMGGLVRNVIGAGVGSTAREGSVPRTHLLFFPLFASVQHPPAQACQIELRQRSAPLAECRDERATEHARSPYQAVPAPLFPPFSNLPTLSSCSQPVLWP